MKENWVEEHGEKQKLTWRPARRVTSSICSAGFGNYLPVRAVIGYKNRKSFNHLSATLNFKQAVVLLVSNFC